MVGELEKLQSSEVWNQTRDEFLATGNAARVHHVLSETVDQMALAAYSSTLRPNFPRGLAMLAVGGYGRRDLFPYSDVDILFLIDDDSRTHSLSEPLAEFMRQMWDAGLRLSHSVHTIDDCVQIHEGNIELSISLLDRRMLGGDADVWGKLEARMPGFLAKHGKKLARHLCEMTKTRHHKFQDTLFHLEPDVKETLGGIRDLHFVAWLGALRPEMKPQTPLHKAIEFLSSLRCFLHYKAGRDANVLDFETQEQIIEQPFAAAKTAPLWMREYFTHARAVYREAHRTLDAYERSEANLLASFRDMRSRPSNLEFTVSRNRVLLKTPTRLEQDPEMILRLVEFVARHGYPAAAETERRLELSRDSLAAWRTRNPGLWPAFKNILRLPHAVAGLRVLQNTGLLEVLLPDWQKVVSLVVRDFYHRYTVDEHTLVCLERLEELRTTRDAQLRRFAGLFEEIDNPALLVFALVYHDVGKGAMAGRHSQIGEEWVRKAMAEMQAPQEDIDTIAFLVLHHLALSDVMRTRDLSDPTTARALADRVGTTERLKLLTVMTYADIAGVNPGAMTPWRMEQLWSTYRAAQQELTRELETDRIQQVPTELTVPGEPGHADFIKGFPIRYLRTHNREQIERHLQLYEASRPTGVAVDLERASGAWQLTVVARDMPSLFASLAGGLSSFGVDILKAEAFSNARGLILDTFVFADTKRTLELNPSETDRLRDLIAKVTLGKADVQRLLKNRPQPQPNRKAAPPRVVFDGDACETATLVEINTEDRPGLLYDLASVFSAACCNIDVVVIDTKGHRALDVFYVAHNGHKLDESRQEVLKTRLLAACQ